MDYYTLKLITGMIYTTKLLSELFHSDQAAKKLNGMLQGYVIFRFYKLFSVVPKHSQRS